MFGRFVPQIDHRFKTCCQSPHQWVRGSGSNWHKKTGLLPGKYDELATNDLASVSDWASVSAYWGGNSVATIELWPFFPPNSAKTELMALHGTSFQLPDSKVAMRFADLGHHRHLVRDGSSDLYWLASASALRGWWHRHRGCSSRPDRLSTTRCEWSFDCVPAAWQNARPDESYQHSEMDRSTEL